MKIQALTALLLIGVLGLISDAGAATPVGGGFSYQGRLLDAGAPAQGHFDVRFNLFTTDSGGSPCAATLTNANVGVSNGVFTTILDFGSNVFTGASCWLEIGVRSAGAVSDFVTLSPRQQLTPAPYSLYTLKAETLIGPLPDTQLSTNIARLNGNQIFTGSVTFSGGLVVGSSNGPAHLDVQGTVGATSFAGNGATLSNVVAVAFSARLAQKLWRVPIPFVTVMNAGNEVDFTGLGAVPYNFRIGKFEINNNQYSAFLNAVAAEDTFHLYSTNMDFEEHGGILRSGSRGDFSYTVKSGFEHKPVVWVDFYDALRFCNWLHNGQPVGAEDAETTEDGAYTLTPEVVAANNVVRNPGARFWLPSGDEWYKAAYHQPSEAGGTDTSYWLYPTRSDEVPTGELPPGGPDSVNACCETGRKLTDVGAYLDSPSYYGTFDQAGNVQEWTEEIAFIIARRVRGGSWNYNEFYSKSSDFEFDTTDYDASGIGFRVAGAVAP